MHDACCAGAASGTRAGRHYRCAEGSRPRVVPQPSPERALDRGVTATFARNGVTRRIGVFPFLVVESPQMKFTPLPGPDLTSIAPIGWLLCQS